MNPTHSALLVAFTLPTAVAMAQDSWLQAPTLASQGWIAHASDRGRTVLFTDGMTWEWSAGWSYRGRTGPASRSFSVMQYDSQRRRVVLFGGLNKTTQQPLDDTWEWDGVGWTLLNPAHKPPARAQHAMAYDSWRQRMVLFGGLPSITSGDLGDTWEWDGVDWVQVVVPGPAARKLMAMAYDTARQQVVLFGGRAGSGVTPPLGDTWTWNGSMWQLAATTGPSARELVSMTNDEGRQLLVLYGGITTGFPSSTVHADTWEWNGSVWSPRPASMAGRFGHSMTYDPAAGQVQLFGGGVSASVSSLDGFDGAQWTNLAIGQNPRPAVQIGATDILRNRVVLFGSDATWEWDGAQWSGGAAHPSTLLFRTGSAIAFDAARGETVLFGGTFGGIDRNDTWKWDGVAWSLANPAVAPPPRSGAAMALDLARGEVVLFGGTASGDTWVWNGLNWANRNTPVAPSARTGHVMAGDMSRNVVVLFGGQNTSFQQVADTWEWDGTAWLQRTPAQSPGARMSASMAYDPTRQRMVLHGGSSLQGDLADSWSWDGSNWTLLSVPSTPPSRFGPCLVHDPVKDAMLMIGGNRLGTPLADAWWLGPLVPAASAVVGTGCAGVGAPPRLTANVPLLGSNLVLDLVGAQGSMPALLLIGTPLPGPVALGNGCSAHLAGPILSLPMFGNAFGFASTQFLLPPNPLYRGLQFTAQTATLASNGAFLGFDVTAGLLLQFGD